MPSRISIAKKVLVFVGLMFLADIIWGLVSLHSWIYLCAGIAAFYILSYWIKKA